MRSKKLMMTTFCHKSGCGRRQCRELKKWLMMVRKGKMSSFTFTCSLPRPRYSKGIIKISSGPLVKKCEDGRHKKDRQRSSHSSFTPRTATPGSSSSSARRKTSVKCPRHRCSFVSKSNVGLKRHLMAHDNQNHHSRHCRRCQKSGDGVIHSIHCQERPFVCQFCDFRYKTWANFQIHLKIVHPNENVVEESEEDADFSERRRRSRQRQRQRKSAKNNNIPLYRCKVRECQFEEDDEKKLARHLLTVHKLPGLVVKRLDSNGSVGGRRPFVCQVCKIHLKFLKSLNLHMEKFHSTLTRDQNGKNGGKEKIKNNADDKNESQNLDDDDDDSEWEYSSSLSESEEDADEDTASEISAVGSISVCDLTRDSSHHGDDESGDQTHRRHRTRSSRTSNFGTSYKSKTKSQSVCRIR